MKKYFLFFLLIVVSLFSCQTQKKSTTNMTPNYTHTNLLIHESSPYLLQHAHNPVNWYPWGKKAFDTAKANQKLVIISIGYAACHWCHVMEHESFEDSLTAQMMNKHYVSIKVDREEHPDVDKIYMSAVQQLTGRGGWPLNVICLPDGRPVWGGTYFPNNNWKSALEQIADLWQKNPQKLYDVASQLEQGIKSGEIVTPNTTEKDFSISDIQQALDFWKKYKDDKYGGFNRAPKFPMPAQYLFLLRAGVQTEDKEILDFVKLTLDKMAQGGIYDPVNGGFARYATDKKWHIPHFEKMLYDNAQLVSLYSQAYLVFQEPAYKNIVAETLQFVENELKDTTGAFYSSLDADSYNNEGKLKEGAYYVFTKDELKQIIGTDFPLFKVYYNVNSYGLWEDDTYHLIKNKTDVEFTRQYNISLPNLEKKVSEWKKKLYKFRQKRSRPRLDDKTLTSWNALMLNAYVDAYKVFQNPHYLEIAEQNASFLLSRQLHDNAKLWHTYKNGKSKINGLLEDYALLIKALINLYEATGEEKYLENSLQLLQYVEKNFVNETNSLFYFTDQSNDDLIVRPMETSDNVIPSSNAIMAENLFKLGHFFETKSYVRQAQKMTNHLQPKIKNYPPGYYQWLNNILDYTNSFYEIAITGKEAKTKIKELQTYYIPNKIVAFSITTSRLPLLRDRFVSGKTLIYLCMDNTCQLPETEIKEIVKKINIKIHK